ncbi:hypothetical protein [Methylohalomonas lacus]|uniref:hypothetical protein n=1 Tax=Methylohalomonas lacus TaxID=398773 RepID=UPI00216A7908|nr:hypothetical protein [Methylohalomonas lacus]
MNTVARGEWSPIVLVSVYGRNHAAAKIVSLSVFCGNILTESGNALARLSGAPPYICFSGCLVAGLRLFADI